MKKWILIAVFAVALVVAVILASRYMPEVSQIPTDDFSTGDSSSTEESTDPSIECTLTYEEYQAMSGPERQAHLETFADMDAFLAWLNYAKEEYEAHQATRPTINGDGPIDIGDLIGGNNE